MTAVDRVGAGPDALTMKEQGIDTAFVNWRGFFAALGLPADKLAVYQDAIAAKCDTPERETIPALWLGEHSQLRR